MGFLALTLGLVWPGHFPWTSQPISLHDPHHTLPQRIWNKTIGPKYSLRIISKFGNLSYHINLPRDEYRNCGLYRDGQSPRVESRFTITLIVKPSLAFPILTWKLEPSTGATPSEEYSHANHLSCNGIVTMTSVILRSIKHYQACNPWPIALQAQSSLSTVNRIVKVPYSLSPK